MANISSCQQSTSPQIKSTLPHLACFNNCLCLISAEEITIIKTFRRTVVKAKLVFFIMLFLSFLVNAQQFSRVQSGAVVSDGGDSRAVNWIDYDSDGDLDLYITNGPSGGQNNFFYENDGQGQFTKIDTITVAQDGTPSDGSSWADMNNDGHPDLFVANWYGANNLLYLNNGNGNFTAVPDTAAKDGGFSESAAWADITSDGYADLFVANSNGVLNNFFYINNAAENFSRTSDSPVAEDLAASRHMDFADYDGDGHLDLFIPNENNQRNFLYHNNGDGTFTRILEGQIATNMASSFGSSWGDYDNDGDLDLFVANWGGRNNYLYQNNGDGTFNRIIAGKVVNDLGHSIGTAWADIDNDGDLDLFVANGFSPQATVNYLYLNDGGEFSRDSSATFAETGWSYGAAFGDVNRDGYLDLAVAKCLGASENNALYLNNGGSNNWLTINLEGSASNRSAIGATVRVKATINGEAVWQMRQVSSQGGYCGQNLESHFGLGDATSVDSLIVQWPSGTVDTQLQPQINQVLAIKESLTDGFLRPNLKVDRRLGTTNDLLQFTDLSIAAEATPIISWQWDFDNDGTIDSEERNPQWQYETPGTYSVKLTISNGTDEISQLHESYIIIEPAAAVDISEDILPSHTGLGTNYPNPFNPSTMIEYDVASTMHIQLEIFDMLGQHITTLVNERKTPGRYRTRFIANNLASGVYFYKMSAGNFVEARQMILLR